MLGTPDEAALEKRILDILDSKERIPTVQKLGPWYYNLWKDAKNPRGLWRRTTLAEYRKAEPAWETVIDVDALGAAEKENWVWHGADCLKPDYKRCIVQLSRGGADADVVREFDLEAKSFLKDGFSLPESKNSVGWLDRDHLYVGTDFGAGLADDVRLPADRQGLEARDAARGGRDASSRDSRETSRSPPSATTPAASSATSCGARRRSSRTSSTCAATASC